MSIYIKEASILPVKVYFKCIKKYLQKIQQLASGFREHTNGDKQSRIYPEFQTASSRCVHWQKGTTDVSGCEDQGAY